MKKILLYSKIYTVHSKSIKNAIIYAARCGETEKLMKLRKIIVPLLILATLLLLASCGKDKNGITVTFDANGGNYVASQTVKKGELLTDPGIPVRDGNYEFKGWFRGDKQWDFEKDKVDFEFTLTARWVQIITVHFDSDGGSAVAAKSAEYMAFISEPETPTKPGYIFMGWYHNDIKWEFTEKVVTEPMTLKAKWAEAVTVTFNTSGGSEVAPITIPKGEKLPAPTPPTKQSYAFVGWYLGDMSWDFDVPVVTDITLTAQWYNTQTYTVTFNSDGGTPVEEQHVVNGQKAYKPVSPTKQGYIFIEWNVDGIRWDFDNHSVTSDITLKAIWQEITSVDMGGDGGLQLPDHIWSYSITFNTNGGNPITTRYYPSKAPLAANGHELPTPTKIGSTFCGWYLDGERFTENTPLTADITLTAKWGYSVTFDYGNGMTEIAACLPGSTVGAPTDPKLDGKTFIGWFKNGVKWDFQKDTVDADIVLEAIYSE